MMNNVGDVRRKAVRWVELIKEKYPNAATVEGSYCVLGATLAFFGLVESADFPWYISTAQHLKRRGLGER
jgi:hypothetical protein